MSLLHVFIIIFKVPLLSFYVPCSFKMWKVMTFYCFFFVFFCICLSCTRSAILLYKVSKYFVDSPSSSAFLPFSGRKNSTCQFLIFGSSFLSVLIFLFSLCSNNEQCFGIFKFRTNAFVKILIANIVRISKFSCMEF